MTDPYKVLGLSQRASDDEVKRAYRELSRKFHPDTNANNPLADLAEEKFKEVQTAYEQILKDRENGGYSNYNRNDYSYGRNSGNAPSEESNEWQKDLKLVAAANYINSRNYNEALNILKGMSDRIGQWYYLSAIAHSGMGNNMEALDMAAQAVNMEPNNQLFVSLLNRLQFGRQRYQNTSAGYGGTPSTCGTGNMCCDLWCADSLCECMGGDLCSCM